MQAGDLERRKEAQTHPQQVAAVVWLRRPQHAAGSFHKASIRFGETARARAFGANDIKQHALLLDELLGHKILSKILRRWLEIVC